MKPEQTTREVTMKPFARIVQGNKAFYLSDGNTPYAKATPFPTLVDAEDAALIRGFDSYVKGKGMENDVKLPTARQLAKQAGVSSTHGHFDINFFTGEVLDYNLSETEDGKNLAKISKFDLQEYLRYWDGEPLADHYDILDLGYWTKSGEYIPADVDFRKDYAAERDLKQKKESQAAKTNEQADTARRRITAAQLGEIAVHGLALLDEQEQHHGMGM